MDNVTFRFRYHVSNFSIHTRHNVKLISSSISSELSPILLDLVIRLFVLYF